MRWEAALRCFGRAPWPLLFSIAAIGFALSSRHAQGTSLSNICTAGDVRAKGVLAMVTLDAVGSWALMLMAMMPPLLAMPLMHAWSSSLTRRRLRTAVVFIVGYSAVWMATGLLLIVLAMLLQRVAADDALTTATALAVAWSASPWHRTALNRSHRLRRIGLFGWAADRESLIFGVTHGFWCVLSCWAWMMVPLVAGAWHLPVMLIAFSIMLTERLSTPRRPAWWWPVFLSPLGKLRHG